MNFHAGLRRLKMADIFISYTRSDRDFAERLYRELERFNVRGFMDQSDLAAGSEWSTALRETVRNADALLVILSAAAAQSNWVLAEIGLADSWGKTVIPVLAPGENYQNAVPPLLLDRLVIDARDLPIEDVAARVVASATNTPVELALNEVRSRARRRQRIFSVVAAAFAVLAIISTSAAWYAQRQANDAMLARARAETEAAQAESARLDAEVQRERLEQLTGQSGALAIAPDGNTFAAGGQAGAVILWDVKSGLKLASLKGDQGVISALSFSKDAHLLAAASWDGTITIWNPLSGNLVHRLEANTKAVVAVEFSPDGQELYARRVDGHIQEWRLPDGELMRTFEVP
jgi:hypothetical protein